MCRVCGLREIQPLPEPQARRTEAEYPHRSRISPLFSPATLQFPATEPNLKVKKCFEAELGPVFLDRSGQKRVKGRIPKTQRTSSSEPFLVVLDRQIPSWPLACEIVFLLPETKRSDNLVYFHDCLPIEKRISISYLSCNFWRAIPSPGPSI